MPLAFEHRPGQWHKLASRTRVGCQTPRLRYLRRVEAPRPCELEASERCREACLEKLDVLGTRSLRTLTFNERYLLTRPQVLETDALAGRHVEKQILAGRSLDETETFVRNSLDRAFAHSIHLLRSKWPARNSFQPNAHFRTQNRAWGAPYSIAASGGRNFLLPQPGDQLLGEIVGRALDLGGVGLCQQGLRRRELPRRPRVPNI